MNAALYARVSTEDQALENQLPVLRKWAREQGYEGVEYIDHASGRNTNRPGFRALCADIQRGRVKVVAVVRLDRAFRSVPDMYVWLDKWAARGVEFVSTTQDFDSRTSLGRAMLGILGILAALESDIHRDRVTAGMRRAGRQGKHLGRSRIRLSGKRALAVLADHGGKVALAAQELGVSPATLRRRLKEGVSKGLP